MNGKIVRRVILIFLITGMCASFFGYKYGIFNAFLEKYYTSDSRNTKNSEIVDLDKSNKVEQFPGDDKKASDFNKSTVSIVQSKKRNASEIDYQEIKKMVKDAVEFSGGLEGVIKDNQVVVLKPNLVQMHVDSTGQPFDIEINGPTTDWRVTKAVAQMVRQYNPNGKIYIMEGSAGDSTRKTMEYLKYTHENIPEVDEFIAIEDDTGKWQDFESPQLIKYSSPNGLLHKEYYLNRKYFECDVLISIPCLKTNSGSIVSGAIKNVSVGATPANIYGVSPTNPGRTKMVSHKIIDGELDKWIYDYYMCKPVNFVVVDGLQGFQNGPVPMGKKNIIEDRMNMRIIMAGRDAVALDTIQALIMGWDPQSITYLNYLGGNSMGTIDTAKIHVIGNQVDEIKKDFSIRFSNLGGVRIIDNTPPLLNILNQELINNKMNLTLNIGEETVKVEGYIDDKLVYATLPTGAKKVILDMSEYTKGNHKIKIISYDRYLNHSQVIIDFPGRGKNVISY